METFLLSVNIAPGNISECSGVSCDQIIYFCRKGAPPALEDQDFSSSAKTADGKPWNLKIVSWNINGIRAWVKVGVVKISRLF